MSQIEKTLKKIIELYIQINELQDSGEIPEAKERIFEDSVAKLGQLEDDLREIQNKPTKKKNLITGEFNLRGGYYDFKENGNFTIETFNGYEIELPTERTNEDFAFYLKLVYGVQESDIILNEWYIDLQADTLKFAFAFQTDQEFATPRNEISLITGKKLSFGSFHQNKMYFRLPELKTLPDELRNYPCYGFAIPYSYDGNVPELLNNIAYAIKEGGELADLRAISGVAYREQINSIFSNLQSKKWKSIFTAWGKYKLQPNGTYLRY